MNEQVAFILQLKQTAHHPALQRLQRRLRPKVLEALPKRHVGAASPTGRSAAPSECSARDPGLTKRGTRSGSLNAPGGGTHTFGFRIGLPMVCVYGEFCSVGAEADAPIALAGAAASEPASEAGIASRAADRRRAQHAKRGRLPETL